MAVKKPDPKKKAQKNKDKNVKKATNYVKVGERKQTRGDKIKSRSKTGSVRKLRGQTKTQTGKNLEAEGKKVIKAKGQGKPASRRSLTVTPNSDLARRYDKNEYNVGSDMRKKAKRASERRKKMSAKKK